MSTPTAIALDACACPLCGQPNQCAMAMPQNDNEHVAPCWCVHATFSAELLARVPAHAQRKACICAACAQADVQPTGSTT